MDGDFGEIPADEVTSAAPVWPGRLYGGLTGRRAGRKVLSCLGDCFTPPGTGHMHAQVSQAQVDLSLSPSYPLKSAQQEITPR